MTRDYVALAAQYQADVLTGAIPTCTWVQRACARNRRDLDRQETPGFPYSFDPTKAARICQMAEMLPHIKGPKAFLVGQDEDGTPRWNPIELEPWQCWILTTIFGWVWPDGRRRFRIALSLIPRKNAKSTLAAILVLYMLVADGESGAECYSAATTRDQAKVIAEIAWEMTRRSPGFRDAFGVRLGAKTTRVLEQPATASKFAPLSADANSLDGLNVSLAAVDEFHAHKTRGVYDVLDTATGTRRQPLLFLITTAGVALGSICQEKLQYLEKILDGVVQDETFFGVNYTIDPGDEDKIHLPAIQRKANPNYGVSVQPDDLARKVLEAQQSPAALNNVLTKHFNLWIRTESGWMTATVWQSRTNPAYQVPTLAELPAAVRQAPCWIGVDLGETRDPSSVTLLFKPTPETYVVIPRIYLPAEAAARSPTAQLSGWIRSGHIIETPGGEADYTRIEGDLLALVDALPAVREIDFDHRAARLMMQNIRAALEPKMGRDRVEAFVLDIPQNTETFDPAMKTTEALVLAGKLEHDGNPAMAWMVSNIVKEPNHKGEIYPRKAGGKDSHHKIDAAIALFTALSRTLQLPPPPPKPQLHTLGGR